MMFISSKPALPRTSDREPRSGSQGSATGLTVLMVSLIAFLGISLGGDRSLTRTTTMHQTQAVANNQDSVGAANDLSLEAASAIKAAERDAAILTDIKRAEALLTQLWQAVEVPTAPIESQEWLIAYFRQGWGPDLATALASHYSYTDGKDWYLRYTDVLLPSLDMATAVSVIGLIGREATVHAEFPAIDGPMRYQASSRLYSLILEEERWKVVQVTVIFSELPAPPPLIATPREQGSANVTYVNSWDS